MPSQNKGIFDRILEGVGTLTGVPREGQLSEDARRDLQRQGLLSLGTSLLEASGPSLTPKSPTASFGRAISSAREAVAQAAPAGGIPPEFLAQIDPNDPSSFARVATLLTRAGLLEPAAAVAKIGQDVATKEGARLSFHTRPDGSIVGLDPRSGEMVSHLEPLKTQGGHVQLSPEQARMRDTIRDDLVKEGGTLLELGQTFGLIIANAQDMKNAIESDDRSAAAIAKEAIIAATAKMNDPGSIVRGPEFDRYATAGNAKQRIAAIFEDFLSGTLPVSLLNSIVRNATEQVRAAQQQYEGVHVKSARERMLDVGLPAEMLREPDPFSLWSMFTAGTGTPPPFVPPEGGPSLLERSRAAINGIDASGEVSGFVDRVRQETPAGRPRR
jgi:hypothetical protein